MQLFIAEGRWQGCWSNQSWARGFTGEVSGCSPRIEETQSEELCPVPLCFSPWRVRCDGKLCVQISEGTSSCWGCSADSGSGQGCAPCRVGSKRLTLLCVSPRLYLLAGLQQRFLALRRAPRRGCLCRWMCVSISILEVTLGALAACQQAHGAGAGALLSIQQVFSKTPCCCSLSLPVRLFFFSPSSLPFPGSRASCQVCAQALK